MSVVCVDGIHKTLWKSAFPKLCWRGIWPSATLNINWGVMERPEKKELTWKKDIEEAQKLGAAARDLGVETATLKTWFDTARRHHAVIASSASAQACGVPQQLPERQWAHPALEEPHLHCKVCGGKGTRFFRLNLQCELCHAPSSHLPPFLCPFLLAIISSFFNLSQNPGLVPTPYQYAVIFSI